MIGRISGRLLHCGADHVLIDVGGVGYVVQVPERVLATMPPPGGAVALYTELVVREDLLQLVGFPTPIEKEWHRTLTAVQGVGVRAAMALIGALGPDGLGRAIALGDWAALRAAPGVGPKLAQRIANELKGRAPELMAQAGHLAGAAPEAPSAAPAPAAPPSPAPAPAPAPAAATAEALSALLNLGYGQGEAAAAVAEAARAEPQAATAALIRAALRRLAPGA